MLETITILLTMFNMCNVHLLAVNKVQIQIIIEETESGSEISSPSSLDKCNERPRQATETPSVEKHAHPPRVVYCAIYLTLTLITKFRVSNLHITTR